ncbi:glycosyl hydrolase family 18 protein [Lysinimonas soli]|uniref:Glycosyl hydrolase family 18 protein n=1 Tax=Lysinimonas soli TaxID=1074233 RepID=A0ABW0NNR4_9MICO
MRPRRLIASATAIALLAVVLAGCVSRPTTPRAVAPQPHTAAPSTAVVTGFQPSWGDPVNLDASKTGMSTVAVSGIDIASDGASVTAPTPAVLAQLAHAHRLGLKAEVLLLNIDGGRFSDTVAAAMLGTAANRESAAASLAAVVKSGGWDGVMFDLESLSASEAPGLTAFAAALRRAVGPAVHLDAAIQPSTTPGGYLRQGYDVAGLLRSLDRLTVMAYDQHGTFDPTDPGPVGSLNWQKKVLDALLITAQPGQIDLGVAGYGYRWASDGTHTVGDHRARRLVEADGSIARFDQGTGEWTATLKDGQVFWWADTRSIALRVALAERLGLHGVAVWSLALSDPLTTQSLATPSPTATG